MALGGLICVAFILTAPQTTPEEKTRAARIVQVMDVQAGDEQIFVSAAGRVIPAQQVDIKPQVRGRIVSIHKSLVPGGFIEAGEELIKIDSSDYEIALAERQGALEEAQFEIAVEKGRQVVAAREWTLLEQELSAEEVDRALVLREPHLRRAEAVVQKANADIERAKLDLERTSVKAPFNAVVLEESAELGQIAETGSVLCTLIGTDEFWVQAAVDFDQLGKIRLPTSDQPGASASVEITVGNQTEIWEGRIVRLLSNLTGDTQMARALIAVQDPLGLNSDEHKTPLLIGKYAEVKIDAGIIENALSIPEKALREGERIWVVDSNNELQIRDTTILSRRGDELIVENTMLEGERLIVSNLRTALPGLKVSPQPVGGSNETIAKATASITP